MTKKICEFKPWSFDRSDSPMGWSQKTEKTTIPFEWGKQLWWLSRSTRKILFMLGCILPFCFSKAWALREQRELPLLDLIYLILKGLRSPEVSLSDFDHQLSVRYLLGQEHGDLFVTPMASEGQGEFNQEQGFFTQLSATNVSCPSNRFKCRFSF